MMNFRQFYNFPAISNAQLFRSMRQYQRHPGQFMVDLGMQYARSLHKDRKFKFGGKQP
jgi:hypothetical protein